MAKERKNRDWDETESSILSTNSARMAEEEATKEEPAEKRTLKVALVSALSGTALGTVLTVVGVLVLIVGVIVVGGVISEAQHQRELAKEEERKEQEALRELREDELIHYIEAPEKKENDLQSGITQLYYSKENGLNVEVTFVSGLARNTEINRISLVLKNEKDEVIASAATDIKGVKVNAGETKTHMLYLEPQLVKLTNDPLEKITYEIQVTDTMEKA